MKRLVLAVLVITTLASPTAASPVIATRFGTEPGPEVIGQPVVITLANVGSETYSMGEIWDIEYMDGDGSAFYQWPEDELELEPGESRTWTWDQRVNQCYGECVNVREGDPAPAGRYEVRVTTYGVERTLKFALGQYFTLGFRSRPEAEFKVFVATQPEVETMTAEAAKPDDEKMLITSGIVKKGRPFNSDWNFTMGPRSIELGEVFIEVCDGSPYYVQRHRSEWLGQRWCPWSSYVKRVGL